LAQGSLYYSHHLSTSPYSIHSFATSLDIIASAASVHSTLNARVRFQLHYSNSVAY